MGEALSIFKNKDGHERAPEGKAGEEQKSAEEHSPQQSGAQHNLKQERQWLSQNGCYGKKPSQPVYANLGALNNVQENIGNLDYTDNSDYLTRLLQVQSLLGGQNLQNNQQVYNPYLTTSTLNQYQQ